MKSCLVEFLTISNQLISINSEEIETITEKNQKFVDGDITGLFIRTEFVLKSGAKHIVADEYHIVKEIIIYAVNNEYPVFTRELFEAFRNNEKRKTK